MASSTVRYEFNRVNLFGDVIESVTYSADPKRAAAALVGAALEQFRSVLLGGRPETIRVGNGRYRFLSWETKASGDVPVRVLTVTGSNVLTEKQAGFVIYWVEMVGWRVLSVSVMSNCIDLTVTPSAGRT